MSDTPRSVGNAPRRKPAVTASRRTLVANAPRRKPGRGSPEITQVTPAERREIQRLHLIDGLNQKQISARTGRTRETIADQLKDEDFQMLKREVNATVAEEARNALKGYVGRTAKDWITASGIAAKKGDHRPAREILLHAGVIERISETSGPQMTVVVGMPGHPAMIPPSQEEIDAEAARQEALKARQSANRAGRIIDGVAQPHAARLLAPIPDTPSDWRVR